ncbi:MAG: T9SS type A sorting domain-containing protein [Saprospiraceae bacterium]|nr:T9SS type A sorting domain-containing protein [Saprospiraceae bacterium]
MYTRIAANKVEFIFENIQLPFEDETNDGYVAFKVKTKSTLILGDSLKNLADIYFDYNLPIRTNETQTTIAIPSSTEDIQQDIAIHPNPVQDILFLGNNSDWKKAEIFDISGRLTKVTGVDGFSVDVSGLESGSYILHLSNKDKRGRVKFVKM